MKSPVVSRPVVLLLESDVLVRSAVAAFLRDCGFAVIETGRVDEARTVLASGQRVDVAFLEVDGTTGRDGFALARWIRQRRGGTRIILASGAQRTAAEAGDLCQDGPMLARPYDHRLLEQHIRRLLARR